KPEEVELALPLAVDRGTRNLHDELRLALQNRRDDHTWRERSVVRPLSDDTGPWACVARRPKDAEPGVVQIPAQSVSLAVDERLCRLLRLRRILEVLRERLQELRLGVAVLH